MILPATKETPNDLDANMARLFLSAVVETKQKFGINHVIDVLRGSQSKSVLKWEHTKVNSYGSRV